MSFRGSPIKRPLLRSVGLTRWGIGFLSLSLAILTVGLTRMELAAILWASAFVLLFLYCLAATRITRIVLRRFLKEAPDPVDFTLPSAGVFPGTPVAAQLTADVPRHTAPGVRIAFRVLLRWPGRRPLELTCNLGGGANRRMLEFSPPHRGLYRSGGAELLIRDALGFTGLTVELELAEQLRVFPAVRPLSIRRPPSQEGGSEENRRARRRRSQELLEVRKYFPGDDIRRIHWKVFAHTSELFLRVGEQTPPPESRVLVILDCGAADSVPRRLEADYLDALVEQCAATLLEILGAGYQLYFARCDDGPARRITPEQERRLLGELAAAHWSTRYSLELPAWESFQLLVFSSPGSVNLPRLFGDLRNRKGRLYMNQLPEPPRRHASTLLQRLFLHAPGGRGEKRRGAGPRELQAFQEAMNLETNRWKGRARWKVSIETI